MTSISLKAIEINHSHRTPAVIIQNKAQVGISNEECHLTFDITTFYLSTQDLMNLPQIIGADV